MSLRRVAIKLLALSGDQSVAPPLIEALAAWKYVADTVGFEPSFHQPTKIGGTLSKVYEALEALRAVAEHEGYTSHEMRVQRQVETTPYKPSKPISGNTQRERLSSMVEAVMEAFGTIEGALGVVASKADGTTQRAAGALVREVKQLAKTFKFEMGGRILKVPYNQPFDRMPLKRWVLSAKVPGGHMNIRRVASEVLASEAVGGYAVIGDGDVWGAGRTQQEAIGAAQVAIKEELESADFSFKVNRFLNTLKLVELSSVELTALRGGTGASDVQYNDLELRSGSQLLGWSLVLEFEG